MATTQQPQIGPTQRPKSTTVVMKKKEGGAAKLRKVTQIPQSVMKGGLTLLDTINETINENNLDQQRNVLNLVEALMKEIQMLKNCIKEERLNNLILAEYVTKQESTHKNEIIKIVEELEKERLKRNELENLFEQFVLEAASKPIFANTKLKEKVEQLRSSVEPHEQYKLSEDFNSFPTLSDFKESEKIKTEQHTIPEAPLEESENSEPSQDSGADAEPEPEKPPEIQLKDIPSMVLVEPQVSGFKIENGFLTYTEELVPLTDASNPHPIIEPEKDIPYYQIYFYAKPHINIIVEDPVKGIIVISIATGDDEIFKQHGAIIRLDSGTFVLPLKSRQRKKKVLQHLALSPNAIIKEIRDTGFQDTLKVMEQKEMQIRAKYKFAVLYAKEGQSEAEMFNNVESSPDFEEFLTFLGEKVALQGWNSYSGGLDTKTNTTGTHSIFCLHKGLEIMFHVSTMIPCNEDDEVQVERKRHLGNDVVVLVFKEGNQPFSPKIIRSHFNCVFLVIQKLSVPAFPDTTETFYQLSVCSRDGIPPFPPYIQDPPVFRKNTDFRTFLLHKMINGERQASQYAPEFNQRMTRARTSALLTLAKDFLKK